MTEQKTAYSSRQLISVAEIASTLALSRGVAGFEAIQQLEQAVQTRRLCQNLYAPHQRWQHGSSADRNSGTPASNSQQIWQSLATKAKQRHHGDKDDFNHPTAASTWHLLAGDVFEFAQQGGLSVVAANAVRDLAVRYNPELAELAATAAIDARTATVDATLNQGNTLPEPTLAVPVAEAPEPKRAKRRTWMDVCGPYIAQTYKSGQYTTALHLYKKLMETAGTEGSPFTKGTGDNRGSLFIVETNRLLPEKTFKTNWVKIRAL